MDTQKLNLSKGQEVNLNQEAGKLLKKISVGLGWDFNSNNRIDLDASAVAYDSSNNKIDQCFFNQKSACGGAITSSGDNVTGQGDGDDEVLTIDLEKLPESVTKILVTITNYTEQPLMVVKNAYARAVDAESSGELARYDLNTFGTNTALYMVLLSKTPTGWTMKALGEPAMGKTFQDLVPGASNYLG